MKERSFKGIWIPKEVWLSKDLTLQEKVFLVEISSLDNDNGCYASNGYFADFFGISKTRVSLVIKSLIDKGYIISNIIYKEGSKEILKRVLKESYTPYLTKVKDPIQQKLKDNNTFNNTTNNTYNNSGSFLKKTTPPKTILERKEDFKEKVKGYLNDYDKQELVNFFEYWSEAGDNDKKMRWEKERVFDCNLRIKKWFANKNKWNKDNAHQSMYSLKQTPIER